MVKLENSGSQADAIIYIYHDNETFKPLKTTLKPFFKYTDAAIEDSVTLVWGSEDAALNGKKQPVLHVLSPTGDMQHPIMVDVRRYGEAAAKAIKRILKMCNEDIKSVHFHVQEPPKYYEQYEKCRKVILLACLNELYVPLEVRERGFQGSPVEYVSIDGLSKSELDWIEAVGAGRSLAKGNQLKSYFFHVLDLCGADPERMTPWKTAEHLEKTFQSVPGVKVRVEKNLSSIAQKYPLFYAVSRASLQGLHCCFKYFYAFRGLFVVERHWPCVIYIDYEPEGMTSFDLDFYMVGKGVTYDTGGADLKVNGAMLGMSRDKGGAAAIAGFILAAAKTGKNMKIKAALAMVRNSVGPDSYVADEIIKSRSGLYVRIGNSDAEGRLAMADLLDEMREHCNTTFDALCESEKSICRQLIFSIATLTGHAVRAYGRYGVIMENHKGRQYRLGQELADAGELIGDPFEISRIRREDWDFIRGSDDGRDDILQANTIPSSLTSRGHQYPAAFLMRVSGLHQSIFAYMHLDIAGSAEEASGSGPASLGRPTGSPVLALSQAYLR